MFLAIFFGVIVALVLVGVAMHVAQGRALAAAGSGAVRVESVKAGAVNRTVARYAQFGWAVTEQTSAKSFGSQARVTLTFRKG